MVENVSKMTVIIQKKAISLKIIYISKSFAVFFMDETVIINVP